MPMNPLMNPLMNPVRVAVPSHARHFPHLLDLYASALQQDLAAESVWACLRMPEGEHLLLAAIGQAPPHLASTGIVEPPVGDKADYQVLGPIAFLEAQFDLVLARPAQPFTRLETERLEIWRDLAQHDFLAISVVQAQQALRFQESLRRRGEAERRRLKRELYLEGHANQRLMHDVINDLVPIHGAVEELQDRYGVAEPVDMVLYIERQAKRIHLRLREAMRRRQQPIGATVIDLRPVVAERIRVWQTVFERSGLSFFPALPTRSLMVRASVHEIETIVGNLISNAHKYTPRGGRVSLHVWAEAGMAVLEVADTGLGISDSFRPKLFEPGGREHPEVEGSGVGLHHVHELLTNLNGAIEVESAPQAGSVFRVRLPLAV